MQPSDLLPLATAAQMACGDLIAPVALPVTDGHRFILGTHLFET